MIIFCGIGVPPMCAIPAQAGIYRVFVKREERAAALPLDVRNGYAVPRVGAANLFYAAGLSPAAYEKIEGAGAPEAPRTASGEAAA